jgi:FemAB-related protein (PEP-CTERM system-associated)
VLEVHRLDRGDRDGASTWNVFVRDCARATFFHRAEWQGLLSEAFKHDTYYLYATRDGRVVGVLPLAEVKTVFFGHALTSLPYLAYAGVATDDDEAGVALENEAQRIAATLGVQHLELRQMERAHAGWPRQDHYVTFRKTIAPDDDTNMLAIPRKQRAMVRKGIKNGLVASFVPDVDAFYSLYARGMHRHGTPALPKRWFERLKRTFGDDCGTLVVSSAQGKPLSSVFTFYFRDECLPYYAGDDEDARDLAANDFKYWSLMCDARARGHKVFDYGRSKEGTGSYAFKKNWGFEPAPLSYEFRLYKSDAIPQNNPANKKFDLMIRTWRRLPSPVVNWLGPRVVRGLG